nr:zinc finger protein 862-like [Lytechinus pictus]
MADILNEQILRPTRADGTRWVEHRRRALKALDRNYVAVTAHLVELGSEQRADVKKEDAAKARGMLKKMSTQTFIYHMALYMDILEELSQVSLVFQREDISLAEVVEVLGTTVKVVQDMCNKDGPHLHSVKRKCLDDGSYRGHSLTGFTAGHAEFDASRPACLEPLIRCLEERFSSFKDSRIFEAVTSLNPVTWPEDLKDLDDKVDDGVRVLIDHFETPLVAHGCDPAAVMAEWIRLKKVLQMYFKPGMSWKNLWGTLFRRRQNDFPNFFHVMEIVQVLPLATAIVERGFSLMNRIKTDWRVRLHTTTLDDLMVISLEGPAEEIYTTDSAVTRWFKAGKTTRRPWVEPYGPRPADATHATESDHSDDSESGPSQD